VTVKSPLAALVQYVMLLAAIGLSFWIIIGGIVIEPPAGLIESINRSNQRILRLFGRPAAA
jgi:lipopolysaccharide export system permease protein